MALERHIPVGCVVGSLRRLDSATVLRDSLTRPVDMLRPVVEREPYFDYRRSELRSALKRSADRRDETPPTANGIYESWCELAPWDGIDPAVEPELEKLEKLLALAWPQTMAKYEKVLASVPTRLHAMRAVGAFLARPESAQTSAKAPVTVVHSADMAFEVGSHLVADVAFTRMRYGSRTVLDAPARLQKVQRKYADAAPSWTKATDVRWLRQATFFDLLEMWRSVVPWLDVRADWTQQGAPARRCYGAVMRELGRRHPEALAQFHALRRDGWSVTGAMRGAANHFEPMPAPQSQHPAPAWPPRRRTSPAPPASPFRGFPQRPTG